MHCLPGHHGAQFTIPDTVRSDEHKGLKEMDTQTLLVIFIAVAALSLLLQGLSMFAMALGARKAQKKIMGLVDDVRIHAMPAIMSSREVIQDVTPKIRTITDNLSAVSDSLRSRSDQVSGLVGDVTNRAQAQTARVDDMVKGTLDQITYAAQAVEHGISVPIRQLNGVLNGLRAGVEVLRKKTSNNHQNPDDDLFV